MTNHVPSLETCQRLKDAGFPQQGAEFYWHIRTLKHAGKTPAREGIAAPLLTEILEQLKPYAKQDKWENGWHGYELAVFWDDIDEDWSLALSNSDAKRRDPLSRPAAVDDNPTEAAALLWLELKEKS